MNRRLARPLALLVALTTPLLVGADGPPGFVAEILGRKILGPGLAQAEVRLFAEARIAATPEAPDAATWQKAADRIRADALEQVIFRGEAAKWRDLPTRSEDLGTIDGGPGYRIRKLRYEAVPGFWVPALLYEPEKLEGKVPGVVNFDGHDPLGLFAPYKQVRCINLAKRGMVALNVDWIAMGQLRSSGNEHTFLNHLDLCGTSGVAVFYLLQKRAVDVVLALEHVDPARIAATGLSGGGWQTIFLGSMDPRVALTAPVAGYSGFRTRAGFGSDLGDSEQTPNDLGSIADYTTLTAMLAPRGALLTFNAKDDCCFAAPHALPPLLAAASPIYRLFGQEAMLRTHINQDPGTHNYLKDNREAFYRALGDQFYPGRADYPRDEIPSDSEVKTADQLRVELPAPNATLHSLALGLSKSLPDDRTLATDPALQAPRRARLADVVRARRSTVAADPAGSEASGRDSARLWTLKVGTDWTVPAVELTRGEPKGTTLLLVDGGRKEAGAIAESLLADGHRVIAADVFDVGESRIMAKGYLWNLFVATVGERPVGIQASEVAAIARWAEGSGKGPVSIVAVGPRSSLSSLVAAGLETRAIADLDLRDAPTSLREPIEAAIPYDKAPDRFCFGLLKAFDIPQLVALVAPRKVTLGLAAPTPK